MKKFSHLTSIIVALTFMLSLSTAAFAIPTVTLEIAPGDIYVGDTFDVEVLVEDSLTDVLLPDFLTGDSRPEELLAFGFDVVTLGSIFTYDSYAISSDFDDFSDPFNSGNVSGMAFPAVMVGSNPSVALATLSFTAMNAGAGTLQTLGFYDGLLSGLFYEVSGFDINSSLDISVNESAPVPEPSTILLMGIGLLGLIAIKSRKQKS